jgi:hypothetical protein
LLVTREGRLSKPRMFGHSGLPFRLGVTFYRTASLDDRPERGRLTG